MATLKLKNIYWADENGNRLRNAGLPTKAVIETENEIDLKNSIALEKFITNKLQSRWGYEFTPIGYELTIL